LRPLPLEGGQRAGGVAKLVRGGDETRLAVLIRCRFPALETALVPDRAVVERGPGDSAALVRSYGIGQNNGHRQPWQQKGAQQILHVSIRHRIWESAARRLLKESEKGILSRRLTPMNTTDKPILFNLRLSAFIGG
jgi:hypothetical protein